jgi:hypothetical protein
MLNPDFVDEDERAVAALLEAVSFVAIALRARPKRDALFAVSDPGLSGLARRVVSAFGFRLYCLSSAAETAPTAGGRRFDLIVLEAGPNTARWVSRIRDLPGDLGAAPILALGGEEALRDALADAGVDAFAPAPVTATRMVDVLALLLGARAQA